MHTSNLKNQQFIKNICLICFIFLIYENGFSQNSGNGFSFQALIRDDQGAILQSENVQIFIEINEEGNSNTLYEESHSIHTDEFGTISLTVGKGQKVSGTLDKFSDINFGLGNLWYSVSIMDNGAKREISNQKLLSVPYAEYAYNVSPVPPGTIVPFGGDAAPPGYLVCNGTSKSRTEYPELFNAIGVIWGSAGSDQFNVPDLRGIFLRGVSLASNKDPEKNSRISFNRSQGGNRVGSYQGDQFKSHMHRYYAGTVNYSEHGTGGETYRIRPNWQDTSPVGGTETRPKNAYVLYIIKY